MAKKKGGKGAGGDVGAGAFAGEVVGNVVGQLLADGTEQLMARFKPGAATPAPEPARAMLDRLSAAGEGGLDVAATLASAKGADPTTAMHALWLARELGIVRVTGDRAALTDAGRAYVGALRDERR